METLLAKGIDGIAVSPIDAENQTPFLNEVAKNTILITQDADAPMSDRLYISEQIITKPVVRW